MGEIYVHKGYCMIEMAMFHDFMQPLISLKIFFQTWIFFKVLIWLKNIVAAFRGMHVSPAKDSYAWLPLESVTTGQTHRRTDRQTPDKVIPMCHDRRHNNISYSKSLKHAPWGNDKIYDVHNDVISDVVPLIIFCQMIPWTMFNVLFRLGPVAPKS